MNHIPAALSRTLKALPGNSAGAKRSGFAQQSFGIAAAVHPFEQRRITIDYARHNDAAIRAQAAKNARRMTVVVRSRFRVACPQLNLRRVG